MFFNMLNNKQKKRLFINQVNVFYNYSLGFEVHSVDLLKTANKLLKSGFSKYVCFSDFKFLYLNENNQIKYSNLHPEGRNWDSSWEINFEDDIPKEIIPDLMISSELFFHENRLVNDNQAYIRTSLPPFVLEISNEQYPMYPGVKIYRDGIAIIYFQFDGKWNGIDDDSFLSSIINMSQRYFDKIWVDAKLQMLDGEVVLENSFEDVFSIGGNYLDGREIRKLKQKMRDNSMKVLTESFEKEGCTFSFDNHREWILHQIAGTEGNESWESTIEMCRSIYSNVISSMLVPQYKNNKAKSYSYLWHGRPSVSLLRFDKQPQDKSALLKNFSESLVKFLNRADISEKKNSLPPDLRKFNDYCLHANRSIYLWTWLRGENESEDIWDDRNTSSRILENQARVEQVEYHNMSISRACSWANNPPSEQHLFISYTTLAETENKIHHSSISGEISDTLSYLIKSFGTESLIASAKEMARFHMDELKYRSDSARNSSNYWLTFVFGLVGVTSFAEFAVNPLILNKWSGMNKVIAPFISFGISAVLVLAISAIIWYYTKRKY